MEEFCIHMKWFHRLVEIVQKIFLLILVIESLMI
nr:MAG TPA: hypothetical protein [Caudoviricetes sp.]